MNLRTVPCIDCEDRGHVSPNCPLCHGKGERQELSPKDAMRMLNMLGPFFLLASPDVGWVDIEQYVEEVQV